MAMNRYGYLDFNKLELGDLVSWEHPVTGKVYDFEVTDADWNDEWQPLELQLLDDVPNGDFVSVSEYAEFFGKGVRRWPYVSDNSHKERYGLSIPENSITLDRLFYTADRAVAETQDSRILADRERMEDFGISKGDGSTESALVLEKAIASSDCIKRSNCPSIPSVTELSEIIHISGMDFKTMVVKGLAEAIKQGKNFIELPPVLIEMHKEELLDLGYEVRFSAICWDHLDWGELGDNMSDLTPKDVKENEFVYYTDPVTNQELKFLVIDVEDELFSNGFTCRLMLLDEPKRIVKILNHQDSSAFSVARQVRQVADDAYKYRDAFDEWPSSDVILLSRCYTKQYGEVIEAVKEKLSLPDASTDFKVFSGFNAYSDADDCDKPFMSAERELAN